MTTDTASIPQQRTGSWGELFSSKHLVASLVLAGGVALYAMNAFITAALLPSVVADIGGASFFSWVTTSFMVASVLSSMLVARTLARWGAARAYLIAFLIFAAGSLGAAFAPAMTLLLIARVLQGLGGGLLAGLGYAVIRDALPQHLWTRATGLVSAMWGLGTLIGPALGGVFAQLGLWRAAFGLLAVVGVVFGFMALRGLPRPGSATPNLGSLPVASLLALVLAAAAFSVAAVVPVGWPTAVALLIGAGLVVAFVVIDRASESSVLPDITYRRGNSLRWIYIVLGILSAAAMAESFLPKFGQELAGLSPLLAGLFGATVSVGWSFVQLFSASVDSAAIARRLMRVGPVLMLLGFIGFALTQHLGFDGVAWLWAGCLVVAGAGVGLAYPHLSVAAMKSSSDPVEGGKAAAGVGTATLIANAISSALVGVFVSIGGPGAAGSAAMGWGVAILALAGVGAVTLALRSGRSA